MKFNILHEKSSPRQIKFASYVDLNLIRKEAQT